MPHKSQYQSHLVEDTSQNAKSTWKSLGPQRYGQQLNTTEMRTHNRQNSKREHRTHKLPLSICNWAIRSPWTQTLPLKACYKEMHAQEQRNECFPSNAKLSQCNMSWKLSPLMIMQPSRITWEHERKGATYKVSHIDQKHWNMLQVN